MKLVGSAGFCHDAEPSLLAQIPRVTGCGLVGTRPRLLLGAQRERCELDGIELLRGVAENTTLSDTASMLLGRRRGIALGDDLSLVRQALIENRAEVMRLVSCYFSAPVDSIDLVGRAVFELQLYQFPQLWEHLAQHLDAGARVTDLQSPGAFTRCERLVRHDELLALCLHILRHAVVHKLERIQVTEALADVATSARPLPANPHDTRVVTNARTPADLCGRRIKARTPMGALTPLTGHRHPYRRSPPPS